MRNRVKYPKSVRSSRIAGRLRKDLREKPDDSLLECYTDMKALKHAQKVVSRDQQEDKEKTGSREEMTKRPL